MISQLEEQKKTVVTFWVETPPQEPSQNTQYLQLMIENLTNRITELESKQEVQTSQQERLDSTLVASGYVGGVVLVGVGIAISSVFPLVIGVAMGVLAMIHSLRMDELGKRGTKRQG